MDFGFTLLLERRRLGIEQRELEQRLGTGYSDSTLSRIEHGKRKVSVEEFARIWQALREEEGNKI